MILIVRNQITHEVIGYEIGSNGHTILIVFSVLDAIVWNRVYVVLIGRRYLGTVDLYDSKYQLHIQID
ncbi:MAG: hypothetical protein IID05_09990 [Gemmatimonadetes bacterium]|nr:hypothetical protein [Gemmatimonadota bacterium]